MTGLFKVSVTVGPVLLSKAIIKDDRIDSIQARLDVGGMLMSKPQARSLTPLSVVHSRAVASAL